MGRNYKRKTRPGDLCPCGFCKGGRPHPDYRRSMKLYAVKDGPRCACGLLLPCEGCLPSIYELAAGRPGGAP